jgi:hypothetical protein
MDGKCWCILWPFGMSCGHLVNYIAIWYFCGHLIYLCMYARFGMLKNLATLVTLYDVTE